MQFADLLYLDHIAKRGRLNRSAGRGIFVKGQMRTAVLVVLEIVSQYTALASSVENDDAVLAFTPNRTDQALDVRVLPMRVRSREDFAYAQPFCGLTELSSIGANSISQQVTRSAVPRKSFNELMNCPLSGGTCCHRKVNRVAAVVRQNHEHKQHLQLDCRHYEEIHGNQVLHMVLQESSPGLRRRLPLAHHVFGDGCLGNLDSEFQQLPMDARGSPSRVGQTHSSDKITDFRGY